MQRLALVTLVVHDYDAAIEYYVGRLDFQLVEDNRLDEDKRWVVVRPSGGGCGILLARAADAAQTASVGNQTGGRVALFLEMRSMKIIGGCGRPESSSANVPGTSRTGVWLCL